MSFLAKILNITWEFTNTLKMMISNNGKIPSTLKQSLKKHYPGAQNVQWLKNEFNNYEVIFIINGSPSEVHFNAEGMIIYDSSQKQQPNIPSHHFPFVRIDKSCDHEK